MNFSDNVNIGISDIKNNPIVSQASKFSALSSFSINLTSDNSGLNLSQHLIGSKKKARLKRKFSEDNTSSMDDLIS